MSYIGKLTIVQDVEGDWSALYQDGKLIYQGHSISADQAFRALSLDYDDVYPAYAEATGFQFPNSLEEVVTNVNSEFR